MDRLKISLLAGAAALASAPVKAADLPIRAAQPIEYVRVCNAYGAGFFYIPGTDTCLRLSGRARFEMGYQKNYGRGAGAGAASGPGNTTGYRGTMRVNLDARTRTDLGTLRAFVRLEAASRTGFPTMSPGTQVRIGNAFPASGVDAYGKVTQYFNTDKAFIQLAGFTAGRASSFYDFYAHDFEIMSSSHGSNVFSTNLLAYTAALGNGVSATLSMEDPSFRRTPIFSSQAVVAAANTALFAQTSALTPVFVGYTVGGAPSGVGFVDMIQRNRMPDFVGALRYDGPWGSAQLSAAVHELNTGGGAFGNYVGTNLGTALSDTNQRALGRTTSDYGWAVQGGLKINLPVFAAGDTLYLQGAYTQGAGVYAGYSNYLGTYIQSVGLEGGAFAVTFADAVLNPFTNKLQLSTAFTAVASLLHYWTPQLRSAFFASYGELAYAQGARFAQGSYFGLLATGPGTPGSRYYQFSQVLRDTYQIYAGASLIWSPVKDLDIGIEGAYFQYGVQQGRVLDLNKLPIQTAAYVNNLANPIRTTTRVDTFQARLRVQRDF